MTKEQVEKMRAEYSKTDSYIEVKTDEGSLQQTMEDTAGTMLTADSVSMKATSMQSWNHLNKI